MPQIHILDDRLISKIAAGEVVERPSSVVKELVENSIDAGAQTIDVELEAGGKRRIVVTDDGCGMGSDDALLAFDRHATSKIVGFDDLEQVATLGFRGEALASIAAVARVELRTAAIPGDGHLVRIEGGRVRRAEPIAHPRGTRIEVASLFFNVPARRKFLKKPPTELRRAVEVVQGYALSHPRLRFTLRHGDRALLETVPVSDDGAGLRQRIGQIFGRAITEDLVEIPLDFITEDEAVSGFVGAKRASGRGSGARRNFVYVNRRLVRDRAVLARFYRAVREEWKSEEYPSLFLFLDLEPSEVDVNVHPQKAEVRFRDLAFVDRVEEALRTALGLARGEEPAPLVQPSWPPPAAAAWEGLGGLQGRSPADEVRQTAAVYDSGFVPQAAASAVSSPAELPEHGPGFSAAESSPSATSPPPLAPPAEARIAQATFEPSEPVAVPLSGRSGKVRPFQLLGQYKGTLILLEGPDGLYLIDQHVAHERLLYESLRRAIEGDRALGQHLLQPLLLELAPAEAMRLQEMIQPLEECGFELAALSGNTIALQAVPTFLSLEEAEGFLQTLAASSGDSDSDAATLRRQLLDALAASMACRAAVKMHRPLKVPEMQRLVSELFQAEQPYACPHGRPVVLKMGDAELERRFGRR